MRGHGQITPRVTLIINTYNQTHRPPTPAIVGVISDGGEPVDDKKIIENLTEAEQSTGRAQREKTGRKEHWKRRLSCSEPRLEVVVNEVEENEVH